MPHSQTGKMMPSSPLRRVDTTRFFGSKPVMALEGINAAITPEINEPRRTKGMPSKISARNENQKFCQLNANHVIAFQNGYRAKTEASSPGRYRIGSRI